MCICMPVGVMAQQVSQELAMQSVRQFLSSSRHKKVKAKASAPLMVAYEGGKEGEKHFYVFNIDGNDGGFVIAGADKCAKEILGFSESGAFDYASAPDNLKWWLSQYDAQIGEGIKQKSTPRKTAGTRVSVPGLISTKWNQDMPFNCMIPTRSNGDRLYTGCVATAMAQIMNYHQWPESGVGSNSYQFRVDGAELMTFSADYANAHYDWNNMQDAYSSDDDGVSDEAHAVGTLMYHAGVAVNMQYGTGGSGANSSKVGPALVKYFDYDEGVQFHARAYYSDEEWEQLVYDEIKAGRPVYYDGAANSSSGHAFVCHGYDSEYDFYQFNWGWGGKADGFYALTGTGALQPNESGIGGAGSGKAYTIGQTIITGIRKKADGVRVANVCSDASCVMKKNGAVVSSVSIDRSQADSECDIDLIPKPANYSTYSLSFEYAVMLRETTTGRVFYSKPLCIIYDLPCGMYEDTFTTTFNSALAEYNGTYEVIPVYRELGADEWKIMRLPDNKVNTIVVSGGEDDKYAEVAFSISCSDIAVGKTAAISHRDTYSGEITYSSSDNSVASIDEDGIIHAISPGRAVVTAIASSTATMNKCMQAYTVTVFNSQADIPVDQLVLAVPPSFGNGNRISASSCDLSVTVRNGTDNDVTSATVFMTIEADGEEIIDAELSTPRVNAYYTATASFCLASLIEAGKFTAGKQYRICFYCTRTGEAGNYTYSNPCNFPSIAFTYCNDVDVTFKMTNAGYGTLCLPFDAPLPEGLRVYECKSYDGDNVAILSRTQDAVVHGNMPYIVRGSEGEYRFKGPEQAGVSSVYSGMLIGVLSDSYTLQSEHHVLQNHNGNIGFYIVGEGNKKGTNAKQFSCLMQIPGSFGAVEAAAVHPDAIFLVDGDDDAELTGVAVVHESNLEVTEIYSITGTRLNALQRGINVIRQGKDVKKVFVK